MLNGCVHDADDFNDFLVNTLGASQDDIINLRDEVEESQNPPRGPATRDNIIAKIKSFKDNNNIEKGDPIVIFFAGHGTQSSRVEWKDSSYPSPLIECICPVDIGKPLKSGSLDSITGIPDFTIRALLNELSSSKGNNIVRERITSLVIFLTKKMCRR